MKALQRAVLCAVLLVALSAVALAGSASAKICSTQGTGALCQGTHGRVIGPFGWVEQLTPNKKATWTSGFVTVNCASAEAEGKWTSEEAGTGNITSQTFSECTSSLGGCTVSSTASTTTPWSTNVVLSTAPNGTETIEGTSYKFTCAGVTCNYGAAKLEAEFIGGEQAETRHVNGLAKQAGSSALCSSTATFEVEWKIVRPASSFIT